tara:strand:+ start:1321 stop:1968 length:648 start_codon:yes stop_codon:yes gene_type:complete
MEDWILRNNTQQDWISLVFLFNFILFTVLGSSNKSEFKYFIRFYESALYFKIYGKDKNRLHHFTVIGTLFLILNFSLILFYSLTFLKLVPPSFPFFINLTTGIFALVLIRFIIENKVFKLFGINELAESFQFKSLSHQIQISILSFFLFLFYQFTFQHTEFLYVILTVILILYVLSQMSLYREYWNEFKDYLLYLILYLCVFKIAPWIVLYSTLN